MTYRKRTDLDCEFCIELNQFRKSRYAEVYGENSPKRIVDSDGEFLLMPTIGQIFFGHSLILTKKHFYSFAEVPKRSLNSLNITIKRIEDALSPFGSIVLFEHGTSPQIGSGCGIYHTHIHVVPVSDYVPPDFLLQDDFIVKKSISEALSAASKSREYLLYRGADGKFFVSFPEKKMESQYFRRRLIDYFGLKSSWDWKEYGFENEMVKAIEFFNSIGLSQK